MKWSWEELQQAPHEVVQLLREAKGEQLVRYFKQSLSELG
jgi:hypothetical protein